MNSRLSTRQQEILAALMAGATLRWRIHFSQWRWLLNDSPADGRSVGGLLRRALVQYVAPTAARSNELVLTDAARAWLAKRGVGMEAAG